MKRLTLLKRAPRFVLPLFLFWLSFLPGGYQSASAAGTIHTRIFVPIVANHYGEAVLVAAGDIASCTSQGDEATAALVKSIGGSVAALGDNAYEAGSDQEYASCYDPTWGAFKARTYPTPGNHDYITPGASGYFNYFGTSSGDPSKGYYSYNLGAWHIVVLNSNCVNVGGCNVGTPQETWLKADLAAHPALCTLAYWHHPYYSSGQIGGNPQMGPLWQDLYAAGAEVILSGHDHDYERFAPQDANANLDPAKGVVEFVVGTGGKQLTDAGILQANSQVFDNLTYGVLRLNLYSDGYSWQFIPAAGGAFTDTGTGACH